MPNFSVDNQYNPSSSGGGYPLSIAPGTTSLPSSPNTNFESAGRLGSGLSSYFPLSKLSPESRQSWLLIDGNVEIPLDSMSRSVWSDKQIVTTVLYHIGVNASTTFL